MRIMTKGAISSSISQAAPSFDPSDITGYELHWIAGSLDGSLNDGDTLTGWADETGNYSINDVGGTPTLEKNEVNGHSVVRFDSTADYVRDYANLIDTQNKWTQVWICKVGSTATQIFFHRAQPADNYIIKRSDDNLYFYATNDVINMNSGNFTPSPTAGNWWIIIWTVDFAGGDFKVYINDVTAQASDTDTGDSSLPPDQYWNIPSSTSRPDNFDLAEVVYYTGHITTSSEISDLLTYYGNKYNISVTT